MELYLAGDGGIRDLTHSACRLPNEEEVMELYLAGQVPLDKEEKMEIYNSIAGVIHLDFDLSKERHSCVLASYHYIKDDMQWAKELNQNFKLFIDSGAFTVHQLGSTIDMDAYITFLHELNPPMIAALDVIGNYQETMRNVEIMEATGLKVIPTFHRGSDIKHFEAMVEKYPYIALGGMAGLGISPDASISWLDRIWRVIAENNQQLKVHGFACTGKKIMGRYPWASVDSSSWLACVRFGRLECEDGRIIHPDDWLAEQYGDEKANPDFWSAEDAAVLARRKLMLLEAARQMRVMEVQLTTKHKDYDWDWLTKQYELF